MACFGPRGGGRRGCATRCVRDVVRTGEKGGFKDCHETCIESFFWCDPFPVREVW